MATHIPNIGPGINIRPSATPEYGCGRPVNNVVTIGNYLVSSVSGALSIKSMNWSRLGVMIISVRRFC